MHHIESIPPSPQEPEGETIKPRGFAGFVQRMYEQAEKSGEITAFDRLRQMHDAGDKQGVETYIDDLVYEAAMNDEEFMGNVNRLKVLRSFSTHHSEEEEAIRTRQNAIFNDYKRDIASLAELPDEAGVDEYEVARDHIREVINHHLEQGGKNAEILKALGILKVNDEGKEIFSYPDNLFPSQTDKKWELYLDRVKDHLRKERGAIAGTLDRSELENADKMRRLAHDAVTRDVHAILGFDKLPESEWGFAQTRNMLAKMRDTRYPNVETAEKARTSAQVLRAANALGILGTKVSNLK